MRNSYFQDPLDPSRRYGRVCVSLAPRWSRRVLRSSYFSSSLFSSLVLVRVAEGGNRDNGNSGRFLRD